MLRNRRPLCLYFLTVVDCPPLPCKLCIIRFTHSSHVRNTCGSRTGLRFDDVVRGGESTLLDLVALMDVFRRRHPEHFATLCRVPVRFEKIHFDRADPVAMVYHRPIVTVNPATDKITQVTWAPPFEGPLPRYDAGTVVDEFYRAYCALAEMIEPASDGSIVPAPPASATVKFRLTPGDVITFNNRRMLHGRLPFHSANGLQEPERHLHGIYVNIDEFKSRHMVMSKRHASGRNGSTVHVANQDYL
eukprot:m.578037 g.578037  ORF g.578037 m.578037 type:complete len:246 (+) comp22303_c0_seq1:140-877(+)